MSDLGLLGLVAVYFGGWIALEIYRMRCLVRLAELAKQEEDDAHE